MHSIPQSNEYKLKYNILDDNNRWCLSNNLMDAEKCCRRFWVLQKYFSPGSFFSRNAKPSLKIKILDIPQWYKIWSYRNVSI